MVAKQICGTEKRKLGMRVRELERLRRRLEVVMDGWMEATERGEA